MRRILGLMVLSLLLASPTLWAGNATGVASDHGTRVIPSEEGDLLYLKRPVAGTEDLKAYTLVRDGGKKVIIVDEAGNFLTPEEAWGQFGPATLSEPHQAPASSPKPPKHS
jgi:hypothetical protein